MAVIAWVADQFLSEHFGGAQQTNDVMIKAGRAKGHKIIEVRPDDFDTEKLLKVDLVITNNITKFSQNDIQWICDNVSFVRYEHDYESVSNHKNPFLNAKKSIFLSPLHYQEIKFECPNVIFIPSPVIDFGALKADRSKNSVIWTGFFSKPKGLERVLQYAQEHADLTFDFYGNHDHNIILAINRIKNCAYRGQLNTVEEKIKAYSSHEYFIHLPNWREPFGRSVMEAYLCGCSLIVEKDRIGALSYNWDYQNYAMIKKETENAPNRFWETIDGVLNELNF